MDGEQLDRVGLGRGGHVEALAELVLGLQPGQQRGQRDLAVDGLELGDRLHEQVEVVAPGRGGRADRRGQLDVDAGGVDDPADQVEDRLADRRRAAGAARRPAAANRAPRLRASSRGRPGRSSASHERGDLGRVGALDGRRAAGPATSAKLAAARWLPASSRARRPEQREVARADRPARPGEQGEQRGVGGDVLDQGQRRDHLGDLGQPQQALEADDLDRDLAAR